MLQFVSDSPLPLPTTMGSHADARPDDPVLCFAGVVTGSSALVIAHDGFDLKCRLMRCGCTDTATRPPLERTNGGRYDIVLLSSMISAGTTRELVQQAKRALRPGGRFLAIVSTASTMANPSVPAMLIRLLRASGFVHVDSRAAQEGLLVRADLSTEDTSRAASTLPQVRA